MVKITRKRYQQGSIRKVARAKCFVWEYRYYVPSDGKRKLKTQTFRGKLYATEADVRRALRTEVTARIPNRAERPFILPLLDSCTGKVMT